MARITIGLEVVRQLPQTQHLTVGNEHIDIMGHMNTMYYWELFSKASRQLTSLTGVTDRYVAQRQLGAFMLKNVTQFIAEVHHGETLTVYTRLIARSHKRYQYMHFMVNETHDKLAATMEALSTHADLQARRSAPFPADVAATMDTLIAAHNLFDWTKAPLSGVLSP